MTDAVIWRDAHDADMFHLGVPFKFKKIDKHTIWATVHVDGMSDLFGIDSEDLDRLVVAGEKPTPIKLEMIFPHKPEAPA